MNVHNWVYTIFPYRHVFVVTYFAKAVESAMPHFSHEHKELALVSPDEANDLNIPEGYKVAIGRALELGLFNDK
jgi:hydrolase, NUDIX family